MTRFVRLSLAVSALGALAVLLAVPATAHAGPDGVVPKHDQPKRFDPLARIDEKIGAQAPMGVTLRDENEQPITLEAAMAGKPTILVPVYYRCPMLCTKVLNGLLAATRAMPQNFSAGEQYTIVAVSMDPFEHSDLAQKKKKAYLEGDPITGEPGYGRPSGEKGWRFLTGTKESVAELLDAVGYRYEFDKMLKEYNHPSSLIILSPKGEVRRYFYGIDYEGQFEQPGGTAWTGSGPKPELTEAEKAPGGPDDPRAKRTFTNPTTTLRLSLIEANDGKGGSLLDKLTLLCYRYDQLHQGYAFKVMTAVRIGGAITLVALVALVVGLVRRERRKATASGARATIGTQGAGGAA